jgi:hypothetical protein
MTFNSFAFLIFFPTVTVRYFALSHRWRWLAAAAHKYGDVSVLDFSSEPDPKLGDGEFAGIQHLTRHGAEIFTGIVLDRTGDGIAAARSDSK